MEVVFSGVELPLYGVLRSSQNNPSTRGIPAPDCRRANSPDSCEVPSVWCALRERSRLLLFFTPLVGTCNAQPLRRFGPKHISAKGHPTGSSLLQKLRPGRAVEDPDNLIRYAARASSGSVHSLPLMIKEPESLKARRPLPSRWCEVQAGTNTRTILQGRSRKPRPLYTVTSTGPGILRGVPALLLIHGQSGSLGGCGGLHPVA
jgi:hypothetical protein